MNVIAGTYEGVPALNKIYSEFFYYYFYIMDKRLNEIISDKTSGSTDLLIKLSLLLQKHLKNKIKLEKLITDAGEHFTSFGIINSYLKNVRKDLVEGDYEKLKRTVTAPLNKHYIYKSIFNNVLPYIKKARIIYSFSNSKTVCEVLKLLKKERKDIKVLLTESRPMNEGRVLAERLLKEKIQIEFGTDALMSSFISRCDAVICGADKLLKDGAVVNKTGSLNAAILADYFRKPFYIVSGSEKIASTFRKDYRDPYEVWPKEDQNLKVHNYYFEIIPSELITKIFLEK
jgi:translation initiation factor 2B subunit (eIF-2B alpha/beta/delta family)